MKSRQQKQIPAQVEQERKEEEYVEISTKAARIRRYAHRAKLAQYQPEIDIDGKERAKNTKRRIKWFRRRILNSKTLEKKIVLHAGRFQSRPEYEPKDEKPFVPDVNTTEHATWRWFVSECARLRNRGIEAGVDIFTTFYEGVVDKSGYMFHPPSI